MITEFASLHNHSHFSVFDGLSLPQELLQAAKDKGLKSIALTDHGVTHGHADWYLLGKKMGVRTIFGVEAYVIHSISEWKAMKAAKAEAGEKDETAYTMDGDVIDAKALARKGHMVILACNRKGLSNLYNLVYHSFKDGFYGKPRMDKEMLRANSEGLVASTACMGGVIAKRCWDMKKEEATWDDVKREALEYDAIFGRGRFFLELQFNEMDAEQNFINDCMVRLHNETGIPMTVTTDSHYSKAHEWEPRAVLHMMGWGKKTINDLPDKKIDDVIKQLYVKSPAEMWQTYENLSKHRIDPLTAQKAFEGNMLIDSLIEDFEPDVHQRLPTLPYPDPFREMAQRAVDGLKILGLQDDEQYRKRLFFELGVIRQKGISNYFLILQQIIAEAKKHMLVGEGRGSSAGSMVCYCLGITGLDPIKHDLLFERFLDIDRVELPDIDTDFEDPKKVKRLLKGMFGEDNVASLSSYGTFQIKGLMKDVGRVYGLDHNEINKLNRLIDRDLRALYVNQDKSTIVIKLEDIKRVSPHYNQFIAAYPELGAQIELLYGRIRHVSRHASAVIIGDDLPRETSCFVVPPKKGKQKDEENEEEDNVDEEEKAKGIVQTSFTEGIVNKNLSAMGFVKMDLLGLANLRVIHYALELIASMPGEKPYEQQVERLRSRNMDMDDMKVMKHIFWDGRFAGIFQFTNNGIRGLAQQVKPDSFTDISAIVSLYRPGPLHGGYDQVYVNAKRNADTIKYDHPILEVILKKTKGCLVFQEQLMQVCGQLGKMSGKDVNRVRKVLLKKDKSKTAEFLQKENDELFAKFQKGCQENEFPEDKTLKLWEDIKAFGGYAFNKSHSDAYSVVTMQTAYLATYYPLQFYAAVLSRAQAGAVQDTLADLRKAKIKVLPIDINKSKWNHTIEGDAIRLSLKSVLGVGPSAVEKIMVNQPYTDFMDFLERSGAGKTAILPLIQVEAFKDMAECGNMHALENFCEMYWLNPKLKTKKNRPLLESLWAAKDKQFGRDIKESPIPDPFGKTIEDYAPHEKVFFENQLMGFSLRGSPFEILERKRKIADMFGDNTMSYQEFIDSEFDDGESTGALAVVLKSYNERAQRNGQMMAFMKFGVEDGTEFEAPCFSTIWAHIKSKARRGGVYIVVFNRKEEEPEKLIVGRPGFAHSSHSASTYFINVDDVP
ncbi:MAG: DNA polymerase III subunit alpha [Acidiferrobacterales bacterium]